MLHHLEFMLCFAVPCAVGTYYRQETQTCEPCPLGTYQSESGQLQCTVCPFIAGRQGVTIAPGARSANDCKGIHSIYLTALQFLKKLIYLHMEM